MKVRFPRDRGAVHYECEIVVRIGRSQAATLPVIPVDEARHWVQSITLGLDMTLREQQSIQKKNGHPWEISKVFTDSAIVGAWFDESKMDSLLTQEFQFQIEHQTRQKGNAKDMIYSIPECISHASRFFSLQEGDLLFTGTPAGVGPFTYGQVGTLKWGDQIVLEVAWKD